MLVLALVGKYDSRRKKDSQKRGWGNEVSVSRNWCHANEKGFVTDSGVNDQEVDSKQ